MRTALAVGAIAACWPAAASAAPTASTLPVDPTLTTDTYALLSGVLNPGGAETSYFFEWGETTAYGNATPVTDASNGKADVPVDVSLDDLKPATVYHYRLVAVPGAPAGQAATAPGAVIGSDQAFRTARSLAASLVGHAFTVKKGKVGLTVRAVGPAGETARGRLSLWTAKATGKGLRRIGSVGYRVPARSDKALVLKLSAAGRQAVATAASRLRVVAALKLNGVKRTVTKKITLSQEGSR